MINVGPNHSSEAQPQFGGNRHKMAATGDARMLEPAPEHTKLGAAAELHHGGHDKAHLY